MKLTANSFYATKIQFFNEVYSVCQKTETDYNKVVERKDVTVKNMLNMYKSHPRFKRKITWDAFYLITGWKHIPNEKIKK